MNKSVTQQNLNFKHPLKIDLTKIYSFQISTHIDYQNKIAGIAVISSEYPEIKYRKAYEDLNRWELLFFALLSAMKISLEIGLKRILIYSNEKEIIKFLKSNKPSKKQNIKELQLIFKDKEKEFDEVKLKYLPFKKNKTAYRLCVRACRKVRKKLKKGFA